MAAPARVAVTQGVHAETGFLVPNKKAPRNPATASGEMASPRSMLADVGRLAAVLTLHRSPPAPGALWGHAPPTWRPGGACRRPNHADSAPGWVRGPGRCSACVATYDPPAQPRRMWAVLTPPGALRGHWSGVGHVGVPQGARKSLNLQIPPESVGLIRKPPNADRNSDARRWGAGGGSQAGMGRLWWCPYTARGLFRFRAFLSWPTVDAGRKRSVGTGVGIPRSQVPPPVRLREGYPAATARCDGSARAF